MLYSCWYFSIVSYNLKCVNSLKLPGIAQCIAVAWFYGLDKFCDDIEYMTGSQPNIYWKICWKFVSPILIVSIDQETIFYYKPLMQKPALFNVIVYKPSPYGLVFIHDKLLGLRPRVYHLSHET